MADEILYEVRGGAARLTIDREERRNALGPGTIESFLRQLDRAESDAAVHVVCITGAGEKAFCSGADLGEALGGEDPMAGPMRFARLLQRMRRFPKPLVARVNGHCLAGGLGPMLACDVVYAREGARLGVPEVKVGLFPMMIAALLLRDGLRKKVLELVYTGEQVSAREAEGLGLVTRAVPDGELDAAVERVLQVIAGNAPRAIQIGRLAMAEADDLPFDQAVEHLCRKLGEVLATEDAAEGLSAFLEKRAPQWKGR
jgi:enoyl-CoA hydratase/carnithine racemase